MIISSPKIWHVKNRDFFQLNWLGSDQWIWRRCCEADLNSAWTRLPCSLTKGRLKGDFLDIYLTTFSESVISEMQILWGSSFDEKYLKFLVDCNNAPKNSEKVFSFWDNYIWNGIVKLSLLRTWYFSSVANVLTSSTKIGHVRNRDCSQLSWLANGQWIW